MNLLLKQEPYMVILTVVMIEGNIDLKMRRKCLSDKTGKIQLCKQIQPGAFFPYV